MSKKNLFAAIICLGLLLAATACGRDSVLKEEPRSQSQAAQAKAKQVSREMAMARTEEAQAVSRLAASVAPRSGLARPAPARPPVQDRERYQAVEGNPIRRVAENPVSTFSIDVDTGSYANVRRFLNQGRMPPSDAVRVEELINYFSYDYPPPKGRNPPFALSAEAAPCPWNPKTVLLRLGLKGYALDESQRPPANLVFLVDVSGSMGSPAKLPLLKSALGLLLDRLGPRDRVAIVTYAGKAGVALEPTPGNERAKIQAALARLRAGGSTAGGRGIELAYAMARQGFIKGGANRVLLATDGDFNVGVTNTRQLLDIVKRQRESGVALSTLGFGGGNYNEEMMERLADAGDGNYSYIDSLAEAQKVLAAQAAGNIFTIARDVKAQVEFNPAVVAEYRLLGYENRLLRREDFRNDKVDAGDIGAGHTVTVLYELALVGSGGESTAPLRYGESKPAPGAKGELGYVKLRYKLPGQDRSQLMSRPLPVSLVRPSLAAADDDLRWAAAVAGFGQLLRGGRHTGGFSYQDVLALARGARGADPHGYRGGFITLVELAGSLAQRP